MRVYPNFKTEVNTFQEYGKYSYHIQYETLIRVKGEDGVWYLFPFRDTVIVDYESSKMFDAISRLNSSAYITQQYTIINEKTKHMFPELTKDNNQQDEKRRLIPLS